MGHDSCGTVWGWRIQAAVMSEAFARNVVNLLMVLIRSLVAQEKIWKLAKIGWNGTDLKTITYFCGLIQSVLLAQNLVGIWIIEFNKQSKQTSSILHLLNNQWWKLQSGGKLMNKILYISRFLEDSYASVICISPCCIWNYLGTFS